MSKYKHLVIAASEGEYIDKLRNTVAESMGAKRLSNQQLFEIIANKIEPENLAAKILGN